MATSSRWARPTPRLLFGHAHQGNIKTLWRQHDVPSPKWHFLCDDLPTRVLHKLSCFVDEFLINETMAALAHFSSVIANENALPHIKYSNCSEFKVVSVE